MKTGAKARKASSEGKAGKQSRRQYTKEYKREAVRRSRDPSISPAQVTESPLTRKGLTEHLCTTLKSDDIPG